MKNFRNDEKSVLLEEYDPFKSEMEGNEVEKTTATYGNNSVKLSSKLTNDDAINIRMSKEEKKRKKMSICKNFFGLLFSNIFVSCGRMCLMNAITSLIKDPKEAAFGLTMISLSQFLGSIFFLTPASKILKLNRLIFVGLIFNTALTLSFYYPTWITFGAGTIITGFGFSTLFGTCFTYGNILAYMYHKITGHNLQNLMVISSGLVFASIASGFLTGSFVFSVLLRTHSAVRNESQKAICGIKHCGQTFDDPIVANSQDDRYVTLITIFTVASVIGVVISFFLRDISDEKPSEPNTKVKKGCEVVREIFKIAKTFSAMLLACSSVLIGMQQAFMASQFTKSFVSCSVGISNVGYAMMGHGLALCAMPLLYWPLVKILGKTLILIIVYIETMAFFFLALFWPTERYTSLLFFIMAILFGISDSLFVSLSTSSYSLLFQNNIEESLFLANFWRACGLMLSYNSDLVLCTRPTVYLQMSFTTLAVILYYALEKKLSRKEKKLPDN